MLSKKPYRLTSRTINLENQKFGKLTAIKIIGSDNGALWLCKCDCDNETVVSSRSLIHGNTKSCGCLRKENMKIIGLNNKNSLGEKSSNFKHGGRHSSEYTAWINMKTRCLNPKST